MTRTTKLGAEAAEILTRVMQEPIPAVGQLTHPLRKGKKSQITLVDMAQAETEQKKFPKDRSVWTVRTLAEYWAKRWQEETGLNYRVTYKADCPIYSELMKIMESNDLDKIEGSIGLIEWAMMNRANLQRRVGYVTPNTLMRVVNEYVQEEKDRRRGEKLARSSAAPDLSLLTLIRHAEAEGKATEIFARFGIPVAVTYFVEIKKFPKDNVEKAIRERLEALMKGGPSGRAQAEVILKASISNGPYPAPFSMVNWRYTLSDIVEGFRGESWWREVDPISPPAPKYIAFLRGDV